MTQTSSKMDGGAGQVFIHGREALGITQEQAADSLNLSVGAIKAIENDDADSLPDIVYVNGYIRSYAKLLGIASQPLIDAWRAQHVMSKDEVAPLNSSTDAAKVDAVNVRPMKMGRWALVALGLSALFVYFVGFTDDAAISDPPLQAIASVSSVVEPSDVGAQADVAEETRADEVTAPNGERDSTVTEITADEASLAEPVVDEALGGETVSEDNLSIGPVAQQVTGQEEKTQENAEETPEAEAEIAEEATEERAQEATAETTEESLQDMVAGSVAEEMNLEIIPDPIAAIESSSLAPDEEVAQIDADVSQAEPEREVATAFALPRLTEFGDHTIELTFSEDCWFEIRTIDGELLYADLGRSGQSRRYLGAAPFRIKLGFSPGATLAYNGEPIDLAPHTRQEVARVLLSEQAAEDLQEGQREQEPDEEQEPQESYVEEPISSARAISLW
jgi:cytoskeletal protein RodZ